MDEQAVGQTYVTDLLPLTAENQAELGSVCTADGEGPGPGMLKIGFQVSMESEVDPAPNGIAVVTSLEITTRLVECEVPENEEGTE